MAGLGSHPRKTPVLEFIFTGLVVIAGAAWFWDLTSPADPRATTASPAVGANAAPQRLSPRLRLGRADAPDALVIVSDFQCPFCARFAKTNLPELRRTFVDTGRLAVYFRHFPLEGHSMAGVAAELSECAGRRGQFWQVHDRLFAAGTRLTPTLLDEISRSLGLPSWQLGACPEKGVSEVVAADQQWALAMGLNGTPFFLLGARQPDGRIKFTESFSGSRTIEQLRTMMDSVAPGSR